MSRIVVMAIGGGFGLMLLVFAALSFMAASRWNDAVRDGAATGYMVVGVFLFFAGLAAIVGTWNHNFRVARAGGSH